MNCLEDTMKLEGRREKNGAGSQSPTDGRDQAEDSTNRDDQRNKLEYSDSPMNEGGQPNRVAVPDVQTRENVGSSKDDSDQTKSRSDIPVTPSEIEIEGSYAKALRKAYAEEPNAKIKAALAAEYEKLTGKSIQ